ncbi:MAG: nicotinate-nucleotide adenylyltransferase [Solirubrobacteraceae bacterium]
MATSGRERLGILGGTFNPPHIGHLVCALQARAQLDLERVMLLPASMPPHKEVAREPGAAHRLRMCELAAERHPELGVCDLEMRRAGPSYTADTLREIHEHSPGAELTFIAGGDIAHSLPSWREPETVLALARLAVAERAGIRREEVRERLASLPGSERLDFIDVPRLDISSELVRQRLQARLPIRYLVPDAVADYIEQRRLYA